MSHETKRKARINYLQALMNRTFEQGEEINQEKLIAECSLLWGASRRTILEYLKCIESLGKIQREKGIIKGK